MPYLCEECGTKYRKLSHLKRHFRTEKHQQSNVVKLPEAKGAEHAVDQSSVRNAAIEIGHRVNQSSVRNAATEKEHTVNQSSVRNVATEKEHTVDQSSVRNAATEKEHTVDQSSVRNAAIDLESLKLYFILFVTAINEQNLRRLARLYQNADRENFLTLTFVGSNPEGVNRDYTSDTDIMCVLNTFICYDDGDKIDEPDKYDFVLKADTSLSPPGYIQGHISHSILEHMWELKELFTCIPKLLNMINGPATRFNSPSFSSGHLYPCKDSILKFGMIFLNDTEYSEDDLRIFLNEFYKQPAQMKIDFVIGVPFVSTKIMQSWENRKRKHGWPSQELIAELKQHGGHIVPVGLHGSSTEDVDWRISHAVIESNLIKSFNEVQLMTYRILKEIISDIPSCTDLTSYHIKNLMLWLAESIDIKHFYPENLLKLIYVSLTIFYKRVEKKILPSYMMPAKNLFQNKLQDHHKILRELKNKIDTLADEWDKSIYRQMFNFLAKKDIITIGAIIFKFLKTIRQYEDTFYETFGAKVSILIVVFYRYNLFSLNLLKKLMNACSLDPQWENLLDSLFEELPPTT